MFNIDDNQILSSSGHCCHYLIITSTSTSTQNTDIYSQLTSYWSTGLRLIKTMEIISLCVTNWSAFLSGCLRFPDPTFLKKWWLAHCTQQMHWGQTSACFYIVHKTSLWLGLIHKTVHRWSSEKDIIRRISVWKKKIKSISGLERVSLGNRNTYMSKFRQFL